MQAIQAIKSSYAGKTTKADTLALKQDIAARQYEMKSDLFDAKSRYISAVDRSKDAKIKPISTMCRKIEAFETEEHVSQKTSFKT